MIWVMMGSTTEHQPKPTAAATAAAAGAGLLRRTCRPHLQHYLDPLTPCHLTTTRPYAKIYTLNFLET